MGMFHTPAVQILEESITDLQHVAYFKQSMERALHMLDEDVMSDMDEDADDDEEQHQPLLQQQQHKASDSSSKPVQAPISTSASPSYVVSLLQNVQPGLVEQLLSWGAVDWHRAVNDAAFSICLLLQLAARNISGGTTSSYNAVAEKELFKVRPGCIIIILSTAVGCSVLLRDRLQGNALPIAVQLACMHVRACACAGTLSVCPYLSLPTQVAPVTLHP
jgi:hypothetical protein